MSGTEKAAILLLGVGEDTASKILKYLEPKEVQNIGSAMKELAEIKQEQVLDVFQDLMNSVGIKTSLGYESKEYLKRSLSKAVGEDKANGLIDRLNTGEPATGLDSLKWMDAFSIYELIRYEHPQIITTVLSYLDGDHAAEILKYLPEEKRTDILLRMASLESIQPGAIDELNLVLEKQFKGQKSKKSSNIGGIKSVADIINFLDKEDEEKIMDSMKEIDESLMGQIKDLMFIFDNLLSVDDRGIQALLRDVSSDDLLLSLKGADEPIKEKFFKNMSKRAADLMKDDLEAKGPVRLSEVEAAQKAVLAVAVRMAEEGEISLGAGAGEEMV